MVQFTIKFTKQGDGCNGVRWFRKLSIRRLKPMLMTKRLYLASSICPMP
jgi:hypothetical protein